MHIEPGVVDGAKKCNLSYATAARRHLGGGGGGGIKGGGGGGGGGGGTYLLKNVDGHASPRTAASQALATRSVFLITMLGGVHTFFEVFPHTPSSVSEVLNLILLARRFICC